MCSPSTLFAWLFSTNRWVAFLRVLDWVKFKTISKCEGEASANNRKSKLIFFYEWLITGEWEGLVKDAEKKATHKGTYEIPNLSEEYAADEVDVSVVLKEPRNDALKDFVRVEGTKLIRAQLAKYITALKEEFAQGIILPTANTPLKDSKPAVNSSPATAVPAAKPQPVSTEAAKKGVDLFYYTQTMRNLLKDMS